MSGKCGSSALASMTGSLSALLSILRSGPMVLDGLQGRYRHAAKTAKSLPDSAAAENKGMRE